ncbi:MAG: hypothetical protein ACLTSZ_13170 [Lachnospiraceae bacterium]
MLRTAICSFMPGKAANAGGVAYVRHWSMCQNSMRTELDLRGSGRRS